MGNKTIKKELSELFSNRPNYKIIKKIEDESIAGNTNYNCICVFKSIEDIYYLIYTTKDNSIISYNIITNQIINKIKNVDDEALGIFDHCLDKINHRDLLLSLFIESKIIKIWNIKNFECILKLQNFNSNECCDSCFLNISEQIYIITTANNNEIYENQDKIKIYDLEGNLIKEINESNKDVTFCVITYYDKKSGINYIVTGNESDIKAYNYEKNKKYKKYIVYDKHICIKSLLIYDKEKITELIGSCSDEKIRIWNFHTGKFLHKIKIFEDYVGFFERKINFLDFENDQNIFLGCSNKTIYLLNLKYGIIIDRLCIHKGEVSFVKKFKTEKYGNILISKGGSIIIWKIC